MGFYDAKGYWRSDGDGFYDAKGNWVSPGGVFYDSKGYLRSPGDGFYDAKGNWVSPGDAFYDGKGYLRTAEVPAGGTNDGITAGIVFLMAIPILLLWSMTVFMVEWMAAHIALIFAGFLVGNVILCLAITGGKRHRGIGAMLSFAGNYVCILSFLYIILAYAVPYVILHDANAESFFEFTVTWILGAGAVAILQFFNYYHENAILEFICGAAFFVIVIKLLQHGTQDIYTMENLAEIYNIKSTALFKVIFGFFF